MVVVAAEAGENGEAGDGPGEVRRAAELSVDMSESWGEPPPPPAPPEPPRRPKRETRVVTLIR
jgi:hypothetical protein